MVALSWYILEDLDGSVLAVAALFGIRSVPNLIMSPLAGVLADRVDRRLVLAAAQLAPIGTATAMLLLAINDTLALWHIYLLIVAWATSFSLCNPARQAMVPSLVPRSDLMNAIALNSLGFNISRALGPTVGGLLLAFLGFTWIYAILIFVYAGCTLTTLAIRTRTDPDASTRAETPWQNFRGGLNYVAGNGTMRGLLILAILPIAIGLPYTALVPVIAKDTLGAAEGGFGLLMSAAGIGALIAGLALASMGPLRRGGALLIVVGLLFGVSVMVLGLSTAYAVAFIANFFAGAFSMFYFSFNNVLVQTHVEERMRGRMASVLMMEFGITPLGALIAGVIAEFTSTAYTVFGMGALLTFMAAAAYFKMRDMHNVGTIGPGRPSAPT